MKSFIDLPIRVKSVQSNVDVFLHRIPAIHKVSLLAYISNRLSYNSVNKQIILFADGVTI